MSGQIERVAVQGVGVTERAAKRPASTIAKIAGYEMRDVVRSRWLLGYGLFFLIVTDVLLRFAGSGAAAVVSVVNIVLFVIPLVTAVFATVYLYNAREFIELLLAHPVRRPALYGGLLLGLVTPLSLAFAVGVAVPFAVHGVDDTAQRDTLIALVLAGVALTAVFTAIAFVIAVRTDDRLRALGTAIAVWLALALLYDGAVLLVAALLADYPLERGLLVATLANPVDLARVLLLLRLDSAALMGYTGAVFQQFFGTVAGTAVASAALVAWIAGPIALGLRAFSRKDF
jgi:Cu-processing system permease protein